MIRFNAEEVPNTQGSVTRVNLPMLARRLHVPVDVLSRSLGGASSTPADDSSAQPSPKSSGGSFKMGGSPGFSPLSSPVRRPSFRVRYMSLHPLVLNIPYPVGAELGVRWEATPSGIIATRILKDSAAARAGLLEGARLLKIGDVDITSGADVVAQLSKPLPDRILQVTVAGTRETASSSPHSSQAYTSKTMDDDILFSPGNVDTDDEEDPFIISPAGIQEPADVEVEVHENGLARLVAGRADSAYIVSDPHSKSAVIAVSDQDQGGSPRSGKRNRSIFESFVSRMSGVLGFGLDPYRSSSPREVPSATPQRRVAFADDTGADLVSSVKMYDEVDTVMLELNFVFPKWVWFGLATILIMQTCERPLMFTLTEHHLGTHLVLNSLTAIETVMLAVLVLPWYRSFLAKENYAFLWSNQGWVCLLLCGVARSVTQTASLLSLTQYTGCGTEVCPPVLLECMAPAFMVAYYSITRCVERRRVGQAEEAWFLLEGVGLFVTVGGAGVVLSQQAGGVTLGASAYALLIAASVAVDLIMKRHIASQMPLPVVLFLIQCVAFVISATWGTALLAMGKTTHHDWHVMNDNKWRLAATSGVAIVLSAATLLVLRHLHPYPAAGVWCFGSVFQVLISSNAFDVPWDSATIVAVPAVLACLLGALLTTWASVHHRSVVEVEIVQDKRERRRKAAGIKGSKKRRKQPKQASEDNG